MAKKPTVRRKAVSKPMLTGLPVAGYRKQSADAVGLVNHNKLTEERILREMDKLAQLESVDKRWLAIARTHMELAFMALNRSIFRPERVQLPEA